MVEKSGFRVDCLLLVGLNANPLANLLLAHGKVGAQGDNKVEKLYPTSKSVVDDGE